MNATLLTNADHRRAVARFGRAPQTSATPVLSVDATEDEWREARRYGDGTYRIGASELAAVLGRSRYHSPFSLWWSKQEGWPVEMGPKEKRRFRWGHRMEQVIGDVFAEDHPEMMIARTGAALWRHADIPWLVCTPDFLAIAPNPYNDVDDQPRGVHIEPVECKSDKGGRWGRPGTDQVPYHHYVQAVTQAMIFGAPRVWVVRNDTPYVIDIDNQVRDQFVHWMDVADDFVASLRDGTPPDLDGHEATLTTVEKLQADLIRDKRVQLDPYLVQRYDTIRRQRIVLDGEYREVQAKIRMALEDAEYGVDADNKVRVQRRVYKQDEFVMPARVVDGLWPMSTMEELNEE